MHHFASKFHLNDVKEFEKNDFKHIDIDQMSLQNDVTGFTKRWSDDNAKKSVRQFSSDELGVFNFDQLVIHRPAPPPINLR